MSVIENTAKSDRLEDESDLQAIREARSEPLYDQEEAENYICRCNMPKTVTIRLSNENYSTFLKLISSKSTYALTVNELTNQLCDELTNRKLEK